jgi:hypothetical protein
MKFYLSLALLGASIGCTQPKTTVPANETGTSASKIEQASWLLGSWITQSSEGLSHEVWEQHNDSVLVGRSYFVNGSDTVSSESIRLIQSGNELMYIPTVPDQNAGVPIAFKLTFIDDAKLVFENPRHDFPQVITYQQINRDSMVAEIAGVIKGEYRTRQFPMRRSQ